MNKYAQVAIEATKMLIGKDIGPKKACEEVASKVFCDSISSQKKGCPKGTYLGLCENGNIIGVVKGEYTKSLKNKEYAIRAVEILKENDQFLNEPKKLWEIVAGIGKAYNSQMDIVCELWKAGMIYIN